MSGTKQNGGEPARDGAPSFEEAIERLEAIVEELEAGTLSLEDSIARYEEGMKLSRRLAQTLDDAEKRIERLVEAEREGERPTTRPLEAELAERPEPEAIPRRPGAELDAPEDVEGKLPF
jgi:exodeoxyribonuclease VII small subunit